MANFEYFHFPESTLTTRPITEQTGRFWYKLSRRQLFRKLNKNVIISSSTYPGCVIVYHWTVPYGLNMWPVRRGNPWRCRAFRNIFIRWVILIWWFWSAIGAAAMLNDRVKVIGVVVIVSALARLFLSTGRMTIF